jgi:uncharacterized protein with von Willebrand factor type A (vWA) domain
LKYQAKDAPMSADSLIDTDDGRPKALRENTKKHFAQNFSEITTAEIDDSRNLIQFRKLKIANRWTSRQRAERSRAGTANRTWLLSIIEHSKTE